MITTLTEIIYSRLERQVLDYRNTVKPHLSQHPFIATPGYCNMSLPFIAINFTIFFSLLLVEGVVT